MDKKIKIEENNSKFLFDVTTLAEYLSLKKATIYKWVSRGVLPYVKLGKLVRFRRDQILNWVASQPAFPSKNGYIEKIQKKLRRNS